MSLVVPTSAAKHHIIIHHLSDLHYHRELRSTPQQAAVLNGELLVKYRGYLDGLVPDRRPDLLVITGDLTASGNAGDLATVQEILRHDFPRWAGDLSDHIFIVPGPSDINWEETNSPGLKTFYSTFQDFGLPSVTRSVPAHAVRAQASLSFIVYPIDTCYTLEECREEMNVQFHRYGTDYQTFVRQYQKALHNTSGMARLFRGDRGRDLEVLRKRYLQLTESNDLTLLDVGRIHQDDLTAFTRWADSLGKDQSAADTDPLKILITHHPLALEHGEPNSAQDTGASRTGTLFEQLASAAGKVGFHLALHGHIHKPHVLADLSILQDASAQHPMRQVGAGSLGDGGTFNEITAIYSSDDDQRHWRLEIRTINLNANKPNDATRFVLLNRTEDAAKHAEDLEREKARRDEFDVRVQGIMREFSEAVYGAQPASTLDRPPAVLLPQPPLLSVDRAIREIVFPGFGLRVRLFVKDQSRTRPIPKLNALYLAPPYTDGSSGPGPVTYPASLAALSLVLGKTIAYPDDLTTPLDDQDYEWLRRSGKDRELIRVLETWVEEAGASSYPGPVEAQQYAALLAKLNRGKADPLRRADFYRDVPPSDSGQSYPAFICIPYPKRPSASVVPEMPEVAVLVVSVKAPDKPTDERVTPEGGDQSNFTTERVGMLETLAELAGMILVSSSALAKPKGVWDARLWA